MVLKYARTLYGVDKAVYVRLQAVDAEPRLPEISGFRFHDTKGSIAARYVLFVGVKALENFGYAEIREFSRKALVSLAGEAPKAARHLAFTIHGPGYGLDEAEAFKSELAGVVDAISSGDFPNQLTTITFVEKNAGRAKRLSELLTTVIPGGSLPSTGGGTFNAAEGQARETLRAAGYSSDTKPHVFVAMPFAEAMDDVFHYGIQGAVNTAGFLCERADLSTFTGDVMNWVRQRISSATLVVADLSSANPNVYLEVGYAWGCSVPTVLLAKDVSDLKFDVRGQRCIVYKSIKQLEDALRTELQGLSLIDSGSGAKRDV